MRVLAWFARRRLNAIDALAIALAADASGSGQWIVAVAIIAAGVLLSALAEVVTGQ